MGKKKTTEEFKKEVYDNVGNEYEVLGDYINNRTNIKMKHMKCGHIYSVRPYHFLGGSRCPECSRNLGTEKRRKTIEDFKREVYEKVGNEYTVLGEYINARTNIEMKHNICGHVYTVRPSHFLESNSRCPECSKYKKKTNEEFKKEVYDKVGEEYTVLSEYINSSTHIKIKHNTCEHIYYVTPSKFLSERRCPACFGSKKKTTEEFINEVFEKVGDEYTVLGEYINAHTPVEIKHNTCEHTYYITPDGFLNSNNRCTKCSGYKKKTTEDFINEVFEKVGNEYTVLGQYINARTHIEMKHNTCGHIYPVTPTHFLSNNRRCPKCTSSKGELIIISFLDRLSINYKHDVSYGDCSYRGTLRFDFLIFDKDDNLKLICEFDGIQHFEPLDIFGGEEGFIETQIRDNIKNEFCKENSIPLLRIPYWEKDNIYNILEEKLSEFGLL